jgi:Flp pilus assembly protein TadG
VKMRKLFHNDKDGQSIVEFAMILPVLLLVLFGITEFGRAIMVTNVLNSASREGARLAAVSAVGDSLSVRNRVLEVLNAANIEAKTIDIQVSALDRTVTVTVTTDFEVLSGGILDAFMGTYELKGTTVMRYEG